MLLRKLRSFGKRRAQEISSPSIRYVEQTVFIGGQAVRVTRPAGSTREAGIDAARNGGSVAYR